MKALPALCVAMLLCGCGDSDKVANTPPASGPKGNPALVLSLEGSGGVVTLGESLDKAKLAFPPPKNATTYDTSMSFTAVSAEGWAWSTADETTGFEAGSKDGKIVALALTGSNDAGEPQATIDRIGQPSRKAATSDGKLTVYTWTAGDKARIWVRVAQRLGFIPPGGITMIGKKEDLAKFGYNADNPEAFVQMYDTMNSPEMRKVFEDAKRRAKAKAQQWRKKP
jgi:hypothetical protein